MTTVYTEDHELVERKRKKKNITSIVRLVHSSSYGVFSLPFKRLKKIYESPIQ